MKRTLDVSAATAFDLLSDLRGHGRWIPLTAMSAPARIRRGDVVVARTAGVFLDRMEITAIEAPHRLRLAKLGPWLLGEAGIDIIDLPRGRCEVHWWERVHLAGPLPAWATRAVMRLPLEAMTWLALRRVSRWVNLG
ncbi:MAG TPA: SRPBCC family protein [Actinomycetaceae bacterium]|nr:SRPBCC family protein [Actinomycetaceae bacterium]